MNPKAQSWNEPPPMETGAPEPALVFDGANVRVAYRCSDDSEDLFAVLEFKTVGFHSLGPPSDETLYGHPLHKLGVDYYGFYSIPRSSRLADFVNARYSHWVVTFHDETLEVVAMSASVVNPRVMATSSYEALRKG